MSIEGRIRIELSRRPDGSGEARITSTRPLGLTRAFEGKSLEDTVRTLPLVFNVCGMAQGTAAVEASEHALGQPADPETRIVRRILVLAETLREHLIRIATDSAGLFGVTPPQDVLLRALRVFEGLRRAADPERRALGVRARVGLDTVLLDDVISATGTEIEELVIGEPAERFAARATAGEIAAWADRGETAAQVLVRQAQERGWRDAGAIEVHHMPPLDSATLARHLLDDPADGFIRQPAWAGLPCETTALGRQWASPLVQGLASAEGPGLLARLIARILELASLPARLRRLARGASSDPRDAAGVSAASLAPGRGIAHVEAARGRLVHAVETEDGKVRRYAILAPTEWNFHPEGAAARGLAAIAAKGESVREIADLFVAALDPCVAYDLEVR